MRAGIGARLVYDGARNVWQAADVSYVVEAANWTVRYDGVYITTAINRRGELSTRLTSLPLWLRSSLIHFGSFKTYFLHQQPYRSRRSAKKILTVFHLQPGNSQYDVLAGEHRRLDFIHTSAAATAKDLVAKGVPEAMIRVIPLGVDVSLFSMSSPGEKKRLRAQLGIPEDAVVIGSFQKDGTGWERGDVPKLEKGPDVFVDVVHRLKGRHPVFVLLVGPARGYMERALRARNIPYHSVGYLSRLQDVAQYYHALDLYLITSRVEGGPKALLESWASGVPVVSTRMGMVADVAAHEKNVLAAPVGDAGALAAAAIRLIERPRLARQLSQHGRQQVLWYTWDKTAQRYIDELYRPCLKNN